MGSGMVLFRPMHPLERTAPVPRLSGRRVFPPFGSGQTAFKITGGGYNPPLTPLV